MPLSDYQRFERRVLRLPVGKSAQINPSEPGGIVIWRRAG